MTLSHLPLNALRAFEAAARQLSFTRAGLELRVTQAAVSHQVKALEEILGVPLFRRLPRGLALTEEGEALLPVLTDAFRRIAGTLDRFEGGRLREVLTLGAVGTFVTGWLLPRLPEFQAAHPFVDLRLLTNNNRVDLAGEGLDYAIRFGDGAWHGTEALPLLTSPLSPLCAPGLARRLRQPADLMRETLLRSYRTDEWAHWFAAVELPAPNIRGFVFDSSLTMAEAAVQGLGIGLLPARMFEHDLRQGRLARPFAAEVTLGGYWLARLKSRRETQAMTVFRDWLLAQSRSMPDAP
ncbi:LysR family transcriptional regulator [Pseudoroseomonas wenyumeiae]|uniref:LysR family transcriptional regulator n=1 Tax=Teichococcus wenyumeiae TaxID=2478470 RepID=A0A3A9JIC9_9PROT|nr:LysR family transcriptional regulator [Pseudoroseomonas wenyumeiae]RKK03466.1 LysR family transcriptional regulator [Pseudoroseomonas wenyumeiae]RMI20500.1 LysR family transcriptional regulator [Pseudoroseomonas wenyumeiae]